MSDDLVAEFGSSIPVRFNDSLCAAMYDSAGNIMLCSCGKPAGTGIIGVEAYQVWCIDCSPWNKYETQLNYKPPKQSKNI